MLTKRKFLVGSGMMLAGGLVAMPAVLRAQNRPSFSYKWGASLDSKHPIIVRVQEALNEIRKETNGQLDIQLFPNGQLGRDTDMVSQLRSGAIQFVSNSAIGLTGLVPHADVGDMPFAFPAAKSLWPAMDGELGEYTRELISKANLFAFRGFYDFGFRTISSNNKPVTSPKDLQGFKIRVPPSKMLISMFKALGAAPVTMNVGETFTALQTGLVDGQENPLIQTFLLKFNEVQKYCSLTRHSWTTGISLANTRAMADLPDNFRQLVEEKLYQSSIKQRADFATMQTDLQKQLTDLGMQFSEPDPIPFRAALKEAKFYEATRAEYGEKAFALVEKFAGSLA